MRKTKPQWPALKPVVFNAVEVLSMGSPRAQLMVLLMALEGAPIAEPQLAARLRQWIEREGPITQENLDRWRAANARRIARAIRYELMHRMAPLN